MNRPVGNLEGADVVELPFAESPAVTADTPTTDVALVLAETLNAIEAARRTEKAEAQDDDEDMWAPGNENVIIRAQPATACYWNDYSQLVVKQEAHWSTDEEPFLTFEPHLLPALIHKLTTEYESWKRAREA